MAGINGFDERMNATVRAARNATLKRTAAENAGRWKSLCGWPGTEKSEATLELLESVASKMAKIVEGYSDALVEIRKDPVIGVGVFLRGIPREELHAVFGKVYDAVKGNTGPVHVAFTEQNSTLVLIPGGIHRG